MPIIATATATVVRNGSMIRVSCVVSSSLPGTPTNSSPDAIALRDRLGEDDAEHDQHAGDDEQRVDDEVAEPPGRARARAWSACA